jgi:molybdate transport system substrate-binding protein
VKRRSTPLIATVAAVAVALAGCSSSDSGGTAGTAATSAASPAASGTTSVSGSPLSGDLTVFAAASLKSTFDQIRTLYMSENPGVTVKDITYDGSSTLVTQLQGGAEADVFASADEKNMDKVADMITGRVDFATNTLVIAVVPGNPKKITGVADLAKSGVVTVICAPEVPCGSAAHTALDAAGVTLTPASEEQNVTAVVTKVASGEADAGLVYTTDVKASGGKVEAVDFPEAAKAVNTYPIAQLTASKNPDAAEAFIALVTGPEGQKILADAGFGKP